MGNIIPGSSRAFWEKFKSVWYAQKGINAELQVEVKWGGWLTWDGLFPENEIFEVKG